MIIPEKYVKRLLERSQDNPVTGCREWKGVPNSNGYGKIGIGKKYYYAHRLAYSAFKGNIPAGFDIRHLCHNKLCILAAHLDVGTRQDNIQDSAIAGRRIVGEKNNLAKLTEKEVIAIRRLCMTGMSGAKIAALFGVTAACISKIKLGQAWKHLKCLA